MDAATGLGQLVSGNGSVLLFMGLCIAFYGLYHCQSPFLPSVSNNTLKHEAVYFLLNVNHLILAILTFAWQLCPVQFCIPYALSFVPFTVNIPLFMVLSTLFSSKTFTEAILFPRVLAYVQVPYYYRCDDRCLHRPSFARARGSLSVMIYFRRFFQL